MPIALTADRLTLVSLVEEDRTPILPTLSEILAFHHARPILVRAQTTAQRTMLAARIDAAIAEADRAVMLVAQGTGCMAAAWWARLSPRSYVSRVAGAVMIAPDSTGYRGAGFASPQSALPFPSIVIGADDETQRIAGEWGSRLIDGPLSIGRPSGRFQSMIDRFTAAIVERDVRAATRLLEAIGDR